MHSYFFVRVAGWDAHWEGGASSPPVNVIGFSVCHKQEISNLAVVRSGQPHLHASPTHNKYQPND